jgi:hypothetical protein
LSQNPVRGRVALLSSLARGIEVTFPQAQAFIRPEFDEPGV